MSSQPPIVTGLSPIEGVPGTKLTIRGENLGNRPEDLIGKYIIISRKENILILVFLILLVNQI